MPKSLLSKIPKLGDTAEDPDPMLYVKWFTPDSSFTWYVAEFDPDSGIAHGFVIGPFAEWGTFDINEIRNIRGALNLPVERDLHFDPCRSSKIDKS